MTKKSECKLNSDTCKYLPIMQNMEETLKNLIKKIDDATIKIDASTEKIDNTKEQIEDIKKRLFVDNGTLSIQSRLTLNEKNIRDVDTKISEMGSELKDKIEEVSQMPKNYIAYTMGLLTFAAFIMSGIIWLINHS